MENEDGVDPGPAFEGADSFLGNIRRLFFRPRSYFAGIAAPKKHAWLFLFAFTYSVAYAIDRSGLNSAQGNAPAGSWAEHWAIIGGSAFIGSLIVLFIGGWWYRVRLGYCGIHDADKDLAKLVYLSAAQVYALPMIVVEIILTIRFPGPADAAALPPRESLGLLVFGILIQVWSYAVSYVGVRTVFKVRKLCAATWFLILPLLFIAVVIGGLYLWAAGGNAPSAVPKADVSDPREFSGFGMAFSYPGNWRVIESDQSPGTMAKVEIEGKGGAYFLLQRMETAESAESFSIKWAESIKQTLSLPTEPQPFDAWGTLKGAGHRFEELSVDAPSEFRLFVAPVAAGQVLMICETFPKAVKGRTERGFKLIRKTFRMTS